MEIRAQRALTMTGAPLGGYRITGLLASGGMGLETLLNFDWELALGEEKVSRAELLELARQKSPLVKFRGQWIEAGAAMIAIDTLVHNFLHRTGILRQLRADHPYGSGCYATGGCAAIIEHIAGEIDARRFLITISTA